MLTATFDAREVEASIAELGRRGQDLRQPMRVIRKEMRLDQREHAQRREGPDGKWPPRAAATVAKARKGSGRARRPMGRLTTAVDYVAQQRRVVGRSRVPWSGAHMVGGRVGNGATLPVRVFLWVSDALVETSARVLQRFLVNGWGRR